MPPAKSPSADSSTELLRSALGLIALQSLPRIGPAKALRAAFFASHFEALVEQHADGWQKALGAAERELDEYRRNGVIVLTIFDERYPVRLRALHDPPPLLFVRGSVDAINDARIAAVVGTREPTRFGCSAAEEITAALAASHWAVVSGLAKGIDTIAHGASLKHHTPTLAVLAGGLDSIYPAANKELAAAIVDQGGALISEQPWGMRPRRSSFVDRNRLQTGLAAAVVVVQTGVVGGTMHTARHAAAQGRPVFCPVPRTRHAKNEGLRVLLSKPARELCGVVPAWKDARALCGRLGDQPLAQPLRKGSLDEFIDALELALESDAQALPQRRWWPALDPPARLDDQDAVDDDQALLFVVAE